MEGTPMGHVTPLLHLLRYDVIGFGSLIATYWLVEIPTVPTLILGADAHALWDQVEAASRVSYLERLSSGISSRSPRPSSTETAWPATCAGASGSRTPSSR
jgi:hypothetical protein